MGWTHHTVAGLIFLATLSGAYGGWSNWGQFSDCSRSCGGGVKVRERQCVVDSLDRNVCKGRSKSFKMCNTQVCSGARRDFRASQCEEYNIIPLDDVKYSWLPYYGHGETCALLCLAKGQMFYHKLADRVVDGTPCHDDPSRRCVHGQCKSIGCDWKVGSYKQTDQCGVCGGDGSSCLGGGEVTGTFHQQRLSPGHTTIVQVPKGSTNVYLREQGGNNNSIVFWDSDGYNFAIDKETRKLLQRINFAGTQFKYTPEDSYNTHGIIQAPGPTSRDFTVYAVNEEADNPDILYGYTPPSSDNSGKDVTPIGKQKETHTKNKHMKSIHDNQDIKSFISKPSNIKISSSSVPGRNYGITNVKIVDRKMPKKDYANTHENALTDREKFVYENGVQILGGDKTIRKNGHGLDTGAQEMRHGTGDPDLTRLELESRASRSSYHDNSRYMWSHGEWTPCSAQCGSGIQRRVVSCVDREERQVTNERSCDQASRPITVQQCDNGDCRTDTTNAFVRWQVGRWGACSTSCDIGDQVQDVFCEAVLGDNSTRRVDNEQCLFRFQAKPQYRRSCNEDVSCPMWMHSAWGKCSVSCGEGVQTRLVDCRAHRGQRRPYPNTSCETGQRPTDRRRCQLAPCQQRPSRQREHTTPRQTLQLTQVLRRQTNPPRECSLSYYGCCPDRITPARGGNYEGCPSRADNSDGVQYARTGGQTILECIPLTADDRRHNYIIDWRREDLESPIIVKYSGNLETPDEKFKSRARLVKDTSLQLWGIRAGDSGVYTCMVLVVPTEQDQSHTYTRQVTLHVSDNIVITEDDATTTSATKDSTNYDNNRGVCDLDPDQGYSRSNLAVKWYYHRSNNTCYRFWYEGLGGNDNRFESEAECRRTCYRDPNQDEDICSLQPMTGRDCRARMSRYYFDKSRGECLQFFYGGCGGNSNNFVSKDDCERECRSGTSALGDQQNDCRLSVYSCCPDGITPARGNNYLGCPVACKNTNFGCCEDGITAAQGPDQEGCDDIDIASGDVPCDQTDYGCCLDQMTPASGPDKAGCEDDGLTDIDDREEVTTSAQCRLPRDTGPCRDDMKVMWYFDPVKNECDRFWYGCRGNANRFKSEKECLTVCRNQVIAPEPLPVCQQEKKVGPCRAALPRYFYNSATGYCENFKYGGCQGNDNNFATEDECVRTCNARRERTLSREEVCRLPQDTGRCDINFFGSASTEYFYNSQTRQCEVFEYSGCGGNRNRFSTQQECNSYCRVQTQATPSPPRRRQPVCELTTDVGPCDRMITKYHFNIASQECETFTYGGCLGNHNNFASIEKCISYCGLRAGRTRADDCRLPPEEGQCRANLQRWYYDSDIRRCRTFKYGGCQGNRNNFASEDECLSSCQTDVVQPVTPAPTVAPPAPPVREEDACSLPLATPCDRVHSWDQFYYYDRSTGQCREVPDGACNNNRNNFYTREQCESFCDRDKVCQPLTYSTDMRCLAYFENWTYNPSTRVCEKFVYGGCGGSSNNFDTEEACNRKCRQEVVTTTTARPDPSHRFTNGEICAMPEEAGNCLAYIRNWRYDSLTGQCVQFTYGGCGGNENNFKSREECERFCSRRVVCERFDEPEISCLAYMPRWRYDPDIRSCENFVYGGCGGNANNFEAIEACERKCIPREEEEKEETDNNRVFSWRDICNLSPSAGPCDNYQRRWHYDSITRECKEFSYGGCLGNHNNFESRDQCMTYCDSSRWSRPRPTTEAPEIVTEGSGEVEETLTGIDVCRLDLDSGSCRFMTRQWHYDRSTGQCNEFVYGGCDGNENRFPSRDACEQQCNPRDVCMLPALTGSCRASIPRYFFDYAAQDCKLFTYGGCVGNANNFGTKDDCMKRCDSLLRDRPAEECDCEWYESCADKGKCVCPEICTLELVPVCGRNRTSDEHKTYGNICGLKSEACRSDGEIEYKSDGDCEDPRVKSGFCPARTDWGGLLGACAPSCQTDKDCQTDQKCCHQGCGYKCVNPVDEEPYQMRAPVLVSVRPEGSKSVYLTWTDSNLGSEQPTQDRRYYTVRFYSYELGQYNYQNVTDMRTRIEGLRPGTTYQFSVRVNNPPYLSEWSEDVEAITGVDGPGVKSGFCPARTDWGGLLGACAPSCQADKDCPTDQKCCHHGCGYKCVNPVDEEPYQMRAPVRVSVRPEDSKSVYLTWTDSNLGSEQLIRDRRYYTVRFYSYKLGQYNYQNVTDMRTRIEGLRPGTTYQFSVRVNNPPYLSEWSEDVEAITGVDVISKPGSCPALDEDNFGICVEECQSDSDCGGPRKCCDNGCGHTCSHPQGYDVCSLMKDPGTCGNWTVRWFFDLEDGACDRFWYGQCGGNENNFLTQGECEAKCGSGEVTTARPRPTVNPRDCRYSAYGCCDDNYTAKQNAQGTNCREYRPPVIPGPSGETVVPVTPGENAILRCKYDGDIAWYRDGKLVTSDERRSLSDGELQVFGANIEDDGMYACHVTSRSGLRIYRYMLQVQVPIGILPGPDIIMVKPNNLAFLHCEVYGNPKPTVSWKKAGETLPTSYRYETFSNGTLLIRNASPEDVDSYTCMADNGVSTPVDRTFKLSLREMLRARIENQNGRVIEGGRIRLSCNGTGYPRPTISWEKSGRVLVTGGNVFLSSDGELTIRDATSSDTGSYSCIVANSEEKIEVSASVQVVPKGMPDDKCEDKTSLMKCRLIVSARLCGYTMYSKICCASCMRYYEG
ncbi:uncharacterized protein LOC128207366 isoform X2 [Mya arenaria]|uniref:uncharacterized protein LOC128207366 isoform X2 n=1 Tax=Mya arenaria TaxID=6604 RepID=UPI0022E78F4A|nr:uncharacterized protein LOC128207366 isoform X2 [Mya arenaria]